MLKMPEFAEYLLGIDEADVSTECTDDSETPPSVCRTFSQAASLLQIEQLHQRLADRRQAACRLRATMRRVIAEKNMQEAEKLFDSAHQHLRDLDEGLLEDAAMLEDLPSDACEVLVSLDKIVADMEDLARNVDGSKARLEDLSALLKQRFVVDDLSTRTRWSRCRLGGHWPRPAGGKPAFRARPGIQHAELLHALSPRTATSVWRHQQVEAGFTVRSSEDGCIILAALPCLDAANLKVRLSADKSALEIAGRCMPTAPDAKEMRQQVASELERFARTSPCWLCKATKGFTDMATQAYAKLGRGRFGHFSASIPLAADVDPQQLSISFDEGVLRITIPHKEAARAWGFGF